MSILFWVVEYLATVVEFYLGCQVVETVVCEDTERGKTRKRELIFSLGAAILVIMINHIRLFSIWSGIVVVFLYIFGIMLVIRKKYGMIILATFIYIAILTGIDSMASQMASIIFDIRSEQTLNYLGAERCFCVIFSKLLLFFFVYIFIKYFNHRVELSKGSIGLITFGTLIMLVFEYYILVRAAGSMDEELRFIAVAFFGASVLLIFLFFFFGIKLMENSLQKKEIELLELQKDMARKAERDTEQALEKWRSSIHDYKHKIYALEAWLRQNDIDSIRRFVQEENEQIAQQETYIRTGNSSADAIINRKRYLAENRGISFDVHALFPEDFGIAEVDLVSILGNLLDNAIEACERQHADNRREMELVIREENNIFLIQISNTCDEMPDADLATTKKVKEYHGIGLKSVKRMVNKYNGVFEMFEREGKMFVIITFEIR